MFPIFCIVFIYQRIYRRTIPFSHSNIPISEENTKPYTFSQICFPALMYLSQDVLYEAVTAASENITQALQDCCGVQLGKIVRGRVCAPTLYLCGVLDVGNFKRINSANSLSKENLIFTTCYPPPPPPPSWTW